MLLLVLIGIKPEHNVSKAEILAFQGKLESNYHFCILVFIDKEVIFNIFPSGPN